MSWSLTKAPWPRMSLLAPGAMKSMSPWPRSFSAPIPSRMVRESMRLAVWNEMRIGRFDLMRPVSTSTLGRCVAMTRWMPTARDFCDRRVTCVSTSLAATIIRSASSSTMTQMCGRWYRSLASCSGFCGLKLRDDLLARQAVEGGDVPDLGLRQHAVPLLHLVDEPAQDRLGLLHVVDDRAQEVRHAVEDRQFHHLRVDEDQPQVVRRPRQEERHDDRVQADALAAAGGAGDQEVRHARQVPDQRVAGGVLAEEEGQAHPLRRVLGRQDDLLQAHDLAVHVRHFNADGVFVGQRRHDPDARGLQRDGDVVRQADDLADLDPRRQGQFVLRDDRPGLDGHHGRLDVELRQGLREDLGLRADVRLLVAGLGVLGVLQAIDRRQLVFLVVRRGGQRREGEIVVFLFLVLGRGPVVADDDRAGQGGAGPWPPRASASSDSASALALGVRGLGRLGRFLVGGLRLRRPLRRPAEVRAYAACGRSAAAPRQARPRPRRRRRPPRPPRLPWPSGAGPPCPAARWPSRSPPWPAASTGRSPGPSATGRSPAAPSRATCRSAAPGPPAPAGRTTSRPMPSPPSRGDRYCHVARPSRPPLPSGRRASPAIIAETIETTATSSTAPMARKILSSVLIRDSHRNDPDTRNRSSG